VTVSTQLPRPVKQLRRFLRGAPATVVWDNLPSHHSRVMGAWLAGQRHWLAVEFLPGYAHDLNPVEGLWANLKGVELANLCRDTITEVTDAARQGIGRVRRESTPLFSFLRHCGWSCDRHDAAGSPWSTCSGLRARATG